MNSQEITKRLEAKGIRSTVNRILVYGALADQQLPQSLKDIEMHMLTIDKSSISRVLSLFLQHDVVHSFEDGRGVLKYELCHEHGKCSHHDNHIHFYCEKCGRSFCMDGLQLPKFELPTGFHAHSMSFVIKGECPSCKGSE